MIKMSKEENQPISIRIKKKYLKRLDEIIDYSGGSRSYLINTAIRLYLERFQDKNIFERVEILEEKLKNIEAKIK
jgi:metal-responsive CopG/Arc/MetJ family transcriptional regulator